MKPGNEYRGARRNEARRLGLTWRWLDAVVDANGSRVIRYPFHRLGAKIVVKEASNGK